MRFAEPSPSQLANWLIGAAAIIAALRAASFFFGVDAAMHFDEGYVAAFGERLLDGHFLPYVDAVSQRGPVLYWAAGLAQAIFGRYDWLGMRVLASVAFVATPLAMLALGRFTERPRAGAIAALLTVFIDAALLEEETVFAVLGEPLATPLAIFAFAMVALALRPSTSRLSGPLLALGGAIAVLAGLTKQTYLPIMGPLALWVLSFCLARRPPGPKRYVPLLWLLAGWSTPPLLVLSIYAIAGELHAFWYWFYTFNREIYMAPFAGRAGAGALEAWARGNLFLVFAISVVLLGGLVRFLEEFEDLPGSRAERLFGASLFLVFALELGVAFAGALAPLRFWSQYHLPPVPWLCLCIGWSLAGTTASAKRRESMVAVGVALVIVLPISLALEGEFSTWRKLRADGRWASAHPEPVCAAIAETTRERDPLFIWGFDSDLYISCERKPASRYLYSTMVQGVVVPFWKDVRPEYVAEGAEETLLAELESQRVPVIIDSPDRARGSSLLSVPWLKQYVQRHYVRGEKLSAKDGRRMTIWRRRTQAETPAASSHTEAN